MQYNTAVQEIDIKAASSSSNKNRKVSSIRIFTEVTVGPLLHGIRFQVHATK